MRKINKKISNGGVSIATILCIPLLGAMFLFQNSANAQSERIIYELDSAIAYGLQSNGSIASANLEVERLSMLTKTSVNIGMTDFGMQYGQMNSFENDFSFSINQNFQFPTVYSNQKTLSKASVEGGVLRKVQTENDLATEIKTTWYRLVYLKEQKELLIFQSEVYEDFLRAAELRYETGAGTLLEKVTAEAKVTNIEVLLAQNEANKHIYLKKLQILLNSPSEVDIPSDVIEKKELKLYLDTNLIESNPNLAILINMIKVSETQYSLEKSKTLPMFSVGYFNQSMIGNHIVDGTSQYYDGSQRFQGLQATLSIPIWARPDIGRIKAAKLNQEKTANEAAYYKTQLHSEYERVIQNYYKYKASIVYYEENALPQAELIIENSKISFENGAINYLEYIQNLTIGLDLKNNYINLLIQYNESIIAIEHLAGKK